MPRTTKHTANARTPPLPQQRDERGGAGSVEEQQLGNPRDERKRTPKLPHERDQSTGAQATGGETEGNAELMDQARKDLESGKQDTDRGPVADATYQRLRSKK
ncbi:hypothetical protein [Piscinibacter sp.]|uniref:hypothetical protein n=1 Tax=Piscinibacter sp. TaxID=1903157 RepID=UPI002C787F89|nr:hypothetical protein [Albitalea sp.]HUG25322.1 hypothetical protein [Albitalea sp.]